MKRFYILFMLLTVANLAAFTISGTVYENEQPTQAIVKLYNQFPVNNAEPFQQDNSSENGNYEFVFEATGVYYVEAASFDNPEQGIFYENCLEAAAATPIHINQANGEITGIDFDLFFLPEANNEILGTVTDENSTALSDATIKLFMLDTPANPPSIAYSGESGNFEFSNLMDGEYLMQVQHPAFQPYFYDGAMSWPQADIIVLEDSMQMIINPVLTSVNSNTVSGYVEDMTSGQPLADVVISALKQNNQSNNPVQVPTVETDLEGEYELELTPGFYQMYAQDPQSGEIQFFPNAASPLNAQWIHVNNDVTDIDFFLNTSQEGNYSVSGNITVGNQPPATPILAVAVSSDEDWEDVTMTDSTGDYEFPSLPEGDYYIFTINDQNTPTYYQDAIDFQEAELVTVNSDISNLNIDAQMPQETGYYEVSGYVSDEENQPVQNATVLFLDEDGAVADFAFTNNLGQYSSPYLSGINYTAIATKTFYNTDSELVTVYGNQSQDFCINQNAVFNSDGSIAENPLNLKVYPNPFNPNANISFSLTEKSSTMKLEIYNIKGQIVVRKMISNLKPGKHNLEWNGKDMHGNSIGSGIYLLKITIDKTVASKKILMLQ
ncbi:MAG: FlgD immunoglobulin-like domain containing protein [Candidatus Cloacimonadota bacterium]|nr:FlgD immunoglobulin-like domain containing protein [Candidatus Cloacimonadota bacterium]